MAGEQPVGHSGKWLEDTSGLLFRIGARIAVIVFAGVLAAALGQGMDPSLALVRALVALIGITALGWFAEQIAGSARQAPAAPEPEPEHNDTGLDE
jgi:hypothetical protein